MPSTMLNCYINDRNDPAQRYHNEKCPTCGTIIAVRGDMNRLGKNCDACVEIFDYDLVLAHDANQDATW